MELSDFIKGLVNLVSPAAPALAPLAAPSGKGRQVVAVCDDYTVQTLDGPATSQRKHVFHDLKSFAEWINKFGNPEATEILVGDASASAVVGADVSASLVMCVLRHHPTFAAWKAIFGRPMPPKDLFSFVRSIADTFGDPAKSGGPSTGDVLAGELAKLKAVTTGDIQMNVDPRGFYSVQGATQKVQVDANIPPQFSVWVPVFINVPTVAGEDGPEKLYQLPILLSMEVAPEKIVFVLTCPSLDRILHDARLDAVAHLRALLDPKFLVGLGDLASVTVPG